MCRIHRWLRLLLAGICATGVPGAVPSPEAPALLDRCATAASRNDLATVLRLAREVSSPDDAGRVNSILSELHLRTGNYHTAGEYLRKVPGDPARAAVLRRCPNQSVAARRPYTGIYRRDAEGGLFLPVSVQGVASEFQIDTGSTVSLVTEAEARRLGLKVSRDRLRVTGLAGDDVDLHLAVARRITVAGVTLRDVTFHVADSKFLSVPGVLGQNLLLALRTIRWGPAGAFSAGFDSPATASAPNLYFDPYDSTPLIDGWLGNKNLLLVLDTADANTTLLKSSGVPVGAGGSVSMASTFGGQVRRAASCSRPVQLAVAGLSLPVRSYRVLSQAHPLWGADYAGSLGADTLALVREVTLDFATMHAHFAGLAEGRTVAACRLDPPPPSVGPRDGCPPFAGLGPAYLCVWAEPSGCAVRCAPKR